MNQCDSTLAFVFPGQGSQSVGMLSDLARSHPEVEAAFSEASSGAGVDLWALVREGPEATLNRTERTQPAILAASVAVWRVWQKLGGPRPLQLAGHSLGEYSALVCADVLSLADAAALVTERGRLMQAAVPEGAGAMAAVLGGDDVQIAEVCAELAQGEVVAPANYNAPGQVVIAGIAAAVDRVLQRLAELGVKKAVRVNMSVPSHCALMGEAAEQLGEKLATVAWQAPAIPVVQNVQARAYESVEDIRAALQRQLYSPVRWTECVEVLAERGVTRLAECGPGRVLSGLAKRIDRRLEAKPLGELAALEAALAAWR